MNNSPQKAPARDGSIFFRGCFRGTVNKEACDPRESSGRENSSSSSYEEKPDRYAPEDKKTSLRREPAAITVDAPAGAGHGGRGETRQSAQA